MFYIALLLFITCHLFVFNGSELCPFKGIVKRNVQTFHITGRKKEKAKRKSSCLLSINKRHTCTDNRVRSHCSEAIRTQKKCTGTDTYSISKNNR